MVVAGATPAFACSCARISTKEQLKGADVVFFGHFERDIPFGGAPTKNSEITPRSAGGYLAKFMVKRVFKGDVGRRAWVTTSGMFGGGCGYRFDDGDYVVVGYRGYDGSLLDAGDLTSLSPKRRAQVEDGFSTNLCGMMSEPALGEVEGILGDGREPK